MLKLRTYAAGLGWLCLAGSLCLAQTIGADPKVGEALRAYLRTLDNDRTTRYSVAWSDLNDDGSPEAIVYLMSNDRCGSGGCTMVVISRSDSFWKTVAKTTITRPPIRVLKAKTHGWHDLGVWVQGGGDSTGL
jgi:hypothetical protein